MFKKTLLQAGLTTSQAEILDYLYQHKKAKASEIAKKIKRSRTIIYKETESLISLNLIKKIDRLNEPTFFWAKHPSALKKLIKNKEKQLQKNKESLKSSLPEIISSYNLISNQPGVRFYEGIRGLKEIYKEILQEKKKLYLIRTAYEPVYNNKIAPIVEEFIEKRIKQKIKVTAIIPSDMDDKKKDALWLMERFNIDKKMYTAPVEIDIFGDKVAILSFGEELIGMIIESKQIAQSLKQIFTLATFISTNKTKEEKQREE
jgi:sugar-specific transcriptional regulator TrmB